LSAGVGADGDAVANGRADERIEGLAWLEVEEGVVRVPDEKTTSFQQTGDTLGDAVQQLRELGCGWPWRPVTLWMSVAALVLAPEPTVNPVRLMRHVEIAL
jgi:hypothetical protein